MPKPKLITTRSAAKSRYFLGAVDAYSRPPIPPNVPKPVRGPLDSYLNSPLRYVFGGALEGRSDDLRTWPRVRKCPNVPSSTLGSGPSKENVRMNPSPTNSEDSLSQFLQPAPENTGAKAYALAGAKLAVVWTRVVVTRMQRAFLVWNRNAAHVKTSLMCGGRVLGGLVKRRQRRGVMDVFWKWRYWTRVDVKKRRRRSIFEESNSKLITRTWKVLAKAVVRRCMAKWREAVRAQVEYDLGCAHARVDELEAMLSNLGTKHESTRAMNESLVKRTLDSEAKSVEYFKLQKFSRLSCGVQKLSTLMVAKRTLGLVFGGGSGKLVKELRNHPCSHAFRKWEVFSRAGMFAEKAREHGLSETLAWRDDRVSR